MKRNINHQLTLSPQDLMVLLKLVSLGAKPATYGELAESLGMSSSEVHASVKRANAGRLVYIEDDRPVIVRAALKEFLLHGAKYAFPATLGSSTRGVLVTGRAVSRRLCAQISDLRSLRRPR